MNIHLLLYLYLLIKLNTGLTRSGYLLAVNKQNVCVSELRIEKLVLLLVL